MSADFVGFAALLVIAASCAILAATSVVRLLRDWNRPV